MCQYLNITCYRSICIWKTQRWNLKCNRLLILNSYWYENFSVLTSRIFRIKLEACAELGDTMIIKCLYEYNNRQWLWDADWKFRYEGTCNCSASRGLPSYPKWWNFQFAPNNHYRLCFLHTIPSLTAFRLEKVLFYQFDTRITTVSRRNVRFGSYVIEAGSKHLVQNDVKNDVKMSKSTSWRYARCRLTPPSYKKEIFWTGETCGKPRRVCKNKVDGEQYMVPVECH